MSEGRSIGTGGLAIRGLSKSFATKGRTLQVLDGIDMDVHPGEFVTVIGPSGCGKSTLFNIVAGLDRPDSGEVLVDGATGDNRLGNIAYMFQKDLLFPWRTVVENTALGLEMEGQKESEARGAVMPMLERFGLGDFADVYPNQLSGGMRQRVAFARTVIQQRSVMLLDEPFGALDSFTRTEMQQWLLDVWEGDRRTILFITHDVAEAVMLSDRVYVMSPRPGRIATTLNITLPRPRDLKLEVTEAFSKLERELKKQLHGHAIGGGSGESVEEGD